MNHEFYKLDESVLIDIADILNKDERVAVIITMEDNGLSILQDKTDDGISFKMNIGNKYDNLLAAINNVLTSKANGTFNYLKMGRELSEKREKKDENKFGN